MRFLRDFCFVSCVGRGDQRRGYSPRRSRDPASGSPKELYTSTFRLGDPGPLQGLEISLQSTTKELLKEPMEFNDMIRYASMFNFNDDSTAILGQRKVCVQLNNSQWSSPFSLRSVEVNQNLAVDDKSDGKLEVGFK